MPYTDKGYRRSRESETWRRLAKEHLATHPRCARCTAPATRCRQPRYVHGDDWLTFDPATIEALCTECAASAAAQDHQAFSHAVDGDGYPIDPRHPARRQNIRGGE